MPDDHHTTATAVHTKEDSPKPEPSADTSITDERSDQRESSEGSDASRSRSPSSDDLRVDTQQHGHVLVNGTDTAQKRKRSHDDDGDEHSPKVEPRSVADRALVMLGDHGSTSPNHQPRTNGVSQYGPQTYAMLPGTPIMPLAWPEQNGLPTPDTPNSNGTDHHWAMSNGSLPNGYNRPVNGDATTPNRPRKRNFSNRTRTGCKTCRNRKKKCDERKPFCGNCEKAGQSCLGYSAAPTAARETTGSTRPPVQIQPVQIREGPPEAVNGVHHHVPDQTAGNKQQPFDERVQPQHATHATEPVSDQPRSTRPPGYPGQPSGHGLPWPPQQGQPHVTPSPSSHILNPSQAPHLDPRGGENSTSSPLRDMRPPTQTTSTAPPPGMTQQIHLPPPSSFASPVPPPSHPTHPSPYYPSQSSDLHGQPRHTDYAQHSRIPSYEHQPAPPPPPSSYGHRPLSKQSTPSTSGPPSTGALFFSSEEVERSKMLRHVRYAHENPTLLWDRARCEAATDKYDHLLALGPGVREDQKRETLSWILDPALDTYYKHNMPMCREKGLLSLNVTVKRGFKCSYGYNLKLLEGVFIDRDVTIDDAGKVEVGARAYIGEGTRIVTSLPCAEMVDRKGPATERVAKDVIIEAEVQIGAGCTILPGVRLGKGCTIVGGTVVEGDVETMHTFGPLEMLERLQKIQRQARW